MAKRFRAAVTLIELTVVLAIVGIIAALTIPAVQSAREATRRVQCQSNLRQFALASIQCETISKSLPMNGWGFAWLGVSSRGSGSKQPGGWIFQSLPFLEKQSVYELTRADDPALLASGFRKLAATPLAVAHCPTRPGIRVQEQTDAFLYRYLDEPIKVVTSDYAINEGDWISDTRTGPVDLTPDNIDAYVWADTSRVTGVSWQRGSIATDKIKDGASHTYLVGEKRVSLTGQLDNGNDQSLYSGVDLDITRWTIDPPAPDVTFNNPFDRAFGSTHATGCNFSMCDGSVRFVSYSIHPDLHRAHGNRLDGEPAASGSH